MARNKFKAQYKGWSGILKRLDRMEKRVATKGANKAVKKALKPILDASKAEARAIQKTGNLMRSLTKKTKIYRRSGNVVGWVGPSHNKKYKVPQYPGKEYRPSFISHFVEKGFKHRSGKKVQGKRFLKNAFQATENDSIKIYRRTLGHELDEAVMAENRKRFKI